MFPLPNQKRRQRLTTVPTPAVPTADANVAKRTPSTKSTHPKRRFHQIMSFLYKTASVSVTSKHGRQASCIRATGITANSNAAGGLDSCSSSRSASPLLFYQDDSQNFGPLSKSRNLFARLKKGEETDEEEDDEVKKGLLANDHLHARSASASSAVSIDFDPFYSSSSLLGSAPSLNYASLLLRASDERATDGTREELGNGLPSSFVGLRPIAADRSRQTSASSSAPAVPHCTPDASPTHSRGHSASYSNLHSAPFPGTAALDIDSKSTSSNRDSYPDIDALVQGVTYDLLLTSSLQRKLALLDGMPLPPTNNADLISFQDDSDAVPPPNTPATGTSPQKGFSSLLGVSMAIMEGRRGAAV